MVSAAILIAFINPSFLSPIAVTANALTYEPGSDRSGFQTFDIIGHLAQPEVGAVLVTPDGV